MKKIYLFIFLAYVVFFCLTLPSQTPDEQGHYEMVYWMSRFTYPWISFEKNSNFYGADESALFNFGNENPALMVNFKKISTSPLQYQTRYSPRQIQTFIPISGQSYNPPLYYLFGAGFLKIAMWSKASLLQQFYVVRLTSALFYFATILVFEKIVKHFYPQERLQESMVLFFALNPLFMQSGIGISPDIAVTFFATLFLWMVLQKTKRETLRQPGDLVVLGLIAGLGALSKISGFFLVPAFIIYLYFYGKNIRSWILASFVFGSTFILTQVPYLTLNWIRYHTFVVKDVALGLVESNTYSIPAWKASLLSLADFRHTIMHFSGFLGQNDVYPFAPVFILYTVVFCLCGSIGLYTLWKKKQQVCYFLPLSTVSVFLFFFYLEFERKVYYHPGWGIGGRNILLIYPQLVLFVVMGLMVLLKKQTTTATWLLKYFSIFYYKHIYI